MGHIPTSDQGVMEQKQTVGSRIRAGQRAYEFHYLKQQRSQYGGENRV
jgi:hypothetical protein